MKKKKTYIKSFGCQMNKLDTAMVSAALEKGGVEFVEEIEDADLVLMNTCSVRENAEKKVYSYLGYLKHLKEKKPNIVVAVMGCMAQRLGEKLLEHEAVDIVCGPAQISNIESMIDEASEKHEKVLRVAEGPRGTSTAEDNLALEKFESIYDKSDKKIPGQAFVRAMRGCNNFCSYCIVPYVRGPEISRPPKYILQQVKRLAGEGVKLINLLGQTVNSYEYRAGDKTYNLADIINMVSEIDGIEWVRFVTNYPQEKYFEDIMKAMADNPKICNYLHMCAQSGSDKILKAMNRRYTTDEYIELVDTAREYVPDIAIAGDFIVGFPNETDEDFQQTVELVKKVRYRNCFIFKYSPRPGTRSETGMDDNIPDEVKKERNTKLLSVQERISEELSRDFEGRSVKVLVEGLSKKPHLNDQEGNSHPQLVGRTEGDWIVVFNGPETLAGSFAQVNITKTSPLTLFGRLT